MNHAKLLLLLLLTTCAWAQHNYVTTFPATENPIAEGSPARWQNTVATLSGCSNGGFPCWNNVKSSGGYTQTTQNQASGNAGFDDATAILANPVEGGTWGANQQVMIVPKIFAGSATGNTQELEIRLRTTIGTNFIHGYEIDFASGGTYIVRWDGTGPYTGSDCTGQFCNITPGGVINYIWYNGSGTLTPDAALKATISGSTITVYRCPTLASCTSIGSVTDSTYATGNPGFGIDTNSTTGVHTDFGISKFIATDGAIVNAADCTPGNVNTAISSAAAAGVVVVPSGTCTWGGSPVVTLNKAVQLTGAATGTSGIGQTNVNITSTNGFVINKQNVAPVERIRDFNFSCNTGVGNSAVSITEGGTWKTDYPLVIQYNTFTANGCQVVHQTPPGGVVYSHNTWNGTSGLTGGDEFIHIYDISDTAGSWSQANTFGVRDTASSLSGTIAGTSGFLNTYVEDNNFSNADTLASDNDDGARVVYRYNTYSNAGINSHGDFSSPFGVRHWEVYNNTFQNSLWHGATGCPAVTNLQNYTWFKGGTGVIYNNQLESLNTGCWGNKSELAFPIEACGGTYPIARQLGQNYSTSQFTDPYTMWGNTVTNGDHILNMYSDWFYTCGSTFTTYMQAGRDYVSNDVATTAVGGVSGSGSGTNAPKSGYTAFTYPHPLVGGTFSAGTFSVSGTISGAGGNSATVSYSGTASGSTTADASGNYTISGLSNGTYTITPSNSGFTFTPANQSVTVSSANVTGVNFSTTASVIPPSLTTATPPTGITQVQATSGGTVTATGGATVTVEGVCYSPTIVSPTTPCVNASGTPSTFTATMTGLTPSTTYNYRAFATNSAGTGYGANQTFTTLATASISGTVTPGAGSANPNTTGVTISLTGDATASTNTDSSGNYTFTGLNNGNYTVTPSKSTYTFSPTNIAVTISGTNQTGKNFTATGTPTVATLNPISFGNQAIGIASAGQTDTLSNTGTGPLSITSISFTGTNAGDFSQTNTCAATLNAAANCGIVVTFTPAAAGARSANLQVVDNATGSPHTAALTGTGVQTPVPTCAPAGGTYQSYRLILCSNSVPAATMCWKMGTPPTTNGAGTCTSGTTYAGPIEVTATGTLYVTGTQLGNVDVSKNYAFTINPAWTKGWLWNLPQAGSATIGVAAALPGTVTLPTTWVNTLEWVGTTTNVINYPATGTGGGWLCNGHAYGPYTASSTTSLNQAVADAEQCRTTGNASYPWGNGSGTQIKIPAGEVFSTPTVNLINLPQTAGDTSTNFIVLQSTTPLPTGRTVCSHGIQDNLPQSTQPGLRNVKCNATALSYGYVTPTTVSGAFTFANGTAANSSQFNDVASMYELDGGNNQIDTQAVDANGVPPHHFAILNANMHPNAGDPSVQAPVLLGFGTETAASQLPNHIHLAYDYIHGDWIDATTSGGIATGPAQGFNVIPNNVVFHCVYCSISYSYMDSSLRPGAEGHGISILLGQHIKIVHNWIEGTSIGHLCGGFAAPITIPNFMVCDDMEDRGNRYTYPYSWVLAQDLGYAPNTFYTTTGGAGSGAVIHLMSINGPPNQTSAMNFEIIGGGSGYALNDVLTMTNTYDPSATGGTVVVTGRGAGNSVTSALMASGSGYSVASGVATTCTAPYCASGGTGATVNITSVSPTGKITGVTLGSGGSGYAASDNITVTGGDGTGRVGVLNVSAGAIAGVQVVSGINYHVNSAVQKNRHEYKFSERIVLDGNIFEGGEFSGGQGQAISFKANQSSVVGGGTNFWTTQNNSTITNNIMRSNCAGMSGGFRSDTGAGGGGGNSDTVANYYYTNNLMYNISIGNPGCQASIAFSTRVASSSQGITWTASTLTRSANVVTVALNGTVGTQNGEGRFHVGDYVRVSNCSPDTSFETGSFTTLGTKAITGTIPASLTVVYPSVGANGTSTCDVSNNQGTPDHFWADHNSEFGLSTINAAQSPSSSLVSPSTKPCALATNGHWTNILSTSGGPNAPPVGEGARTLQCMWDVGTVSYHHNAVPRRDTAVSCPGHTAGAGGIAACYSEYVNGSAVVPPATIYGDATEYCTTNDPTTENCIGIVGEMSTSSFNYNLNNWHDYRLCHGEAACNGKTSPYAAGGAKGGTDGDMGVKSFSAIDAAQVANQYCVPNCSNGSFPDH